MRILADENIDPDLIDWLRAEGHDVVSIREVARGAPDTHVLAMATDQERILLTADKDFGDLVFRRGLPAPGIILLRFRVASKKEFLDLFMSHWPDIAPAAPQNFVIATYRTLRIRRIRPAT